MYRFFIDIEGVETEVSPLLPDGTFKDFDLESGEVFFREKLNQKLKFIRSDFDFINDQPFETKFNFRVSYNPGVEIPTYYQGFFFKTDCAFDEDARRVEVELTPADGYEEILTGLDKEFNLVDLGPDAESIIGRKRPIIQIYIPGSSFITSYYGGNVSEQQIAIDPVTDHTTLVNTYRFTRGERICKVEGITDVWGVPSPDVRGDYDPVTRESTLYRIADVVVGGAVRGYEIRRKSDNAILFKTQNLAGGRGFTINTLPFLGTLGTGTGTVYAAVYDIYVRYLTNLDEVRGGATFARPATDIVEGFRNYGRVIGFNIDNFFHYEDLEDESTPLGPTPSLGFGTPKRFYKELRVAVSSGLNDPFPISKADWGFGSLWFFSDFDIEYTEFIDGEDVELKTNYSLHSVIQKLLGAVGSELTFEADTDHSVFLFNTSNPITSFPYQDFETEGILEVLTGNPKFWITPKSNIVVSSAGSVRGGFQAATIAKITFRDLLTMLKNSMRLFWYIEDGKFRIEHISYFLKGRSYSALPAVAVDLTVLSEAKTKLPWATALNQYSFEKDKMPERIEFKWMDNVTLGFNGFPIEILSPIVQKGLIDRREINLFTSDIDFIVINPDLVNLEGFAVMATVEHDNDNKLPFVEIIYQFNRKIFLQNGWLANLFLHPNFHVFDLPGSFVKINDSEETLFTNIDRKRIQENIKFPSVQDPDPISVVKTFIGEGLIQKMQVNLFSRMVNVTLEHDTQ